MPELPEVETIKRQLQKSLINKKIKEVFVYTDKMIKVGVGKISNIKKGSAKQSEQFSKALKGKQVLGLERRAKFLIIRLSGGYSLMIHLRMSGQLIYIEKKDLKNSLKLSLARTAIAQTLPTKHSHIEFVFSNGDKLFYNDTRQFGHLRLVSQAEMQEVLRLQDLGPEPLKLKLKRFQEIILKYGNRRAKDFLLDQRVIAGIGNIYADESLFISKIHPLRKVSSLTQQEVKKLLEAIQKVLSKAIKMGGSSIEYFLMVNGSAGKFSNEHLVYGKAGKKCPVCGRILLSQKIGSRTSVFCSFCQK